MLLSQVQRLLNCLQEYQHLSVECFAEEAVVELKRQETKLAQVFWVAGLDAGILGEWLRLKPLEEAGDHLEDVQQVGPRLFVTLCVAFCKTGFRKGRGLFIRLGEHVFKVNSFGLENLKMSTS